MPHLYTDEQEQIRAEVRRGLTDVATPATLRRLIERRGAYDQDYWSFAREMGWCSIAVPEAQGGLGLTTIDALIVAEETGRALVGAPFLATGFAIADLLGQGAAPLDAVAHQTRIVVPAFAEGADTLPRLPATRFADGRLFGRKDAVLGAAAADAALVLACDATGRPILVTVDLVADGVTRTILPTIDNSRGLATLDFDAAAASPVAAADPLGAAHGILARLALHLAAEGVGGTGACIALATDHANQRQAFGQAIGKFQAVKHAIAEMYVAGELARASVLHAAVRLDRGDADAEAYVAAARLNAIHSYERAAAGSTQIFGGIGVTWEADLHLHYRRSRSLAAEAGPIHFWEDRLVDTLEAA